MKNLTQWIDEKKKSSRQPMATTPTSAPLRGQNQDQSGTNVKNNTADYTISDEKINELSPELVGRVNKARTVDNKPSKTDTAKKTLSTAVNKAWIKSKAGTIKEMIAGVGAVRIKPVNMGQNTGGQKSEPNAPSNVNQLQSAANSRVAALDQAAQKQKDQQEKDKQDQIKQRQAAANKAKANKPPVPKPTNEEYLDEAPRGRPPKNASSEDPGSDNIIVQLRKVITLRGQAPIKFVDGKTSVMNPGTAHRLLSMYDNLRTSGEKHSFSMRIHKSAESLRDVLMGRKEVHKPKISLGGKISGNQ